jgi:hypothetical protein
MQIWKKPQAVSLELMGARLLVSRLKVGRERRRVARFALMIAKYSSYCYVLHSHYHEIHQKMLVSSHCLVELVAQPAVGGPEAVADESVAAVVAGLAELQLLG